MPTIFLLWCLIQLAVPLMGSVQGLGSTLLSKRTYQAGREQFYLNKAQGHWIEDRVSSSFSSSVFCAVGAEAAESLPYSALLWQTCSTALSSQVRGLTCAVQTSTG